MAVHYSGDEYRPNESIKVHWKMMRPGKRNVLLILAGLTLLAVLVEARWYVVQRFIASAVYDSIPLTASCAELPTLEAVQGLFEEHRDTVAAVEGIHPGFVFVRVADMAPVCPGKGYLYIEYASHQDRVRIEELLGPTFFGVPYKGVNT